MSLPEITAVCRVLARSNSEDPREQARNLHRLDELTEYLSPHAEAGIVACLEVARLLVGGLARGERLGSREILGTVCKLLATVDKNWSGEDPDALIASTLYGQGPRGVVPQDAAAGAEATRSEGGPRLIRSTLSGGHATSFDAEELVEAQRRIDVLKRTPRINEMVLGELLVELGRATAEDVRDAMEEQESSGMLLGQILVEQGVVSAADVQDTVKLQHQLRGGSTQASLQRLQSRERPACAAGDRGGEAHGASPEGGTALRTTGDHLLGEIVLRQGAVTREQLDAAMSAQRASGLLIGEVLVEQGLTDWDTIKRAVDLQRRLRDAAGLNPSAYYRRA